MANIRVHELAKRLGIDNKSILDALGKIGVTGKSHSSALEDHVVAKIKRVLLGYDVEPEPAPAPSGRRKSKAVVEPEGEAPVVAVAEETAQASVIVEQVIETVAAEMPQPGYGEVSGDVHDEKPTAEIIAAESFEKVFLEEQPVEPPPEEPEPVAPSEPPPVVEPPKPPVKKAPKKVVLNLADMQAAARMQAKIPSRIEDLPRITESLNAVTVHHPASVRVQEASVQPETKGQPGKKKPKKVFAETAAPDAEKLPEELQVEKIPDKFAKELSTDKLQKFKGKAFESLQRVEATRAWTPAAPAAVRGTPPPRGGAGGKRPFVKGRKPFVPPQQPGRFDKRQAPPPITAPRRKDLKFFEGTTVKDFAALIGQKVNDVIKKLMELGQMATLNQPIDTDAAMLLADAFGVGIEIASVDTEESILAEIRDDAEALRPRPPVVTVMGHVDHGKTSLLDVIRKTRVTEGEAGGITQHIGAYKVRLNDRDITFLDTPGHAAFTAMRARGAKVTDVVILVVAADDGVMPQTVEAYNHCKAANVPIVVAVNKIDKPDANLERVKTELAELGLVPEEWGGPTVYCEVSAKKNIGIEHLLEMVLLQADILELKANPERLAYGTVVEARLDRGRGPVATILVQNGTLRSGDVIISGMLFGKVRTLTDDTGRLIDKAGPSVPVEVVGLSGVPSAGDTFVVLEDERKARQIAMLREEKQRVRDIAQRPKLSLNDLYKKIQEGEVRELNIVLKTDVQGSVEALRDSLHKITHAEVKVKVIHASAGGITESDIMLAKASNAIVIGFNVRPEPKAHQLAERDGVDIRLYTIIYQAVEEVKQAMEGMLAPTITETILGRAEVRQTFMVSRIGTIAGSYVLDGVMSRKCTGIRVIRDNVVVYQGRLGSLKRFKEDTKEVAAGYECGITIDNFNDIKVGDILEDYSVESVATKLE